MSRLFRVFVVALAAGLVAVGMLALIAVWTRLPQAKPSISLPDGTILRVEALTVGTNHTFHTKPEFIEVLRNYLPDLLQPLLGKPGYIATVNMPQDTAYLWLSQFDPTTGTYQDADVGSLEVLDEAGQVFHAGSSGSSSSTGFKERHVRLDFLPRRASQFGVRFHTQGKEFALEIPMAQPRPPYPVWSPQSLPQSRTTNGYTFTLTGFQVDSWQTNRYHVHPLFEITQNDQDRTDRWDPSSEFVDATGNRCRDSLSFLEPAWKVAIHFFPSAQFPFAPETIHSLGKAPVPKPGEYTVFPRSDILRKEGVDFVALTGPGRYTIRDGGFESAEPWQEGMSSTGSSSSGSAGWSLSYTEPRCRVLVVLRGPSTGTALLAPFHHQNRRLLIRARLRQGGFIAANSSGSSASDDGTTLTREESFLLDLKTVEGNLECELIPLTSTYLEFLTAPPAPKTGLILENHN